MSKFSDITKKMFGGIRGLFQSNKTTTESVQPAQTVWVLFRESGQFIVTSIGYDESRFNCYGEKLFKLPFNATSDDIAETLSECLKASRWNIPNEEAAAINARFFETNKITQKQLDFKWQLIMAELPMKTNLLTIYRMHRIRNHGGHAGDPSEPKSTITIVNDWSPAGEEIRRLLDMGIPDPVSLS